MPRQRADERRGHEQPDLHARDGHADVARGVGSPPTPKIQLPTRVRARTQVASAVIAIHHRTEMRKSCGAKQPPKMLFALVAAASSPDGDLVGDRLGDAEVDALQDEERRQRDDEARQLRPHDHVAVEEADREPREREDDRKPDVHAELGGEDGRSSARGPGRDAGGQVELAADHEQRDRTAGMPIVEATSVQFAVPSSAGTGGGLRRRRGRRSRRAARRSRGAAAGARQLRRRGARRRGAWGRSAAARRGRRLASTVRIALAPPLALPGPAGPGRPRRDASAGAPSSTGPTLLLSTKPGPVSTGWPPPTVLALSLYSFRNTIGR